MKRMFKILLSGVCAIVIVVLLGLGVWKMTYTPPIAISNPIINRNDTDSTTDRKEITMSDGSVWTIENWSVFSDWLDGDDIGFMFENIK